jgi:hypothetical protein
MAFLFLKANDEREYLCSTSNIALITTEESGDVVLTLQKGPRLLGRPGEVKLQDEFRISAGDSRKGVVFDIMDNEKEGGILDLSKQCILAPKGFAVRG